MLGSHRERNPSRSENWHRRTTIYTPSALPPGPRARVRPLLPPRIPRNSAAGDWRWRPRALRDKPDQHQRAEPDNPRRTNTSSSSRRGPETFAGMVRVSGRAGVSSVSSTEANLLPSLFVPSSTDSGVVEYLDRSSAGYNAVETNSRARVAPRG